MSAALRYGSNPLAKGNHHEAARCNDDCVDDPAGCQKAVDLAINISLTHDAHLTAFCPLETMIIDGPQAVVGTYPELFMIHSAAPDALEPPPPRHRWSKSSATTFNAAE